ncbi:MAG: nicotinate (nicotinamide) nucleotide adenylyltransferase [Endomicrobiia bacterium]|nr:nicotinate (nicotinamide) nucleotide adenylyltransferase [Endomicrobiaceae bacterium]MDD3053449.1 nicotinate (nicotinamide) nucleotide adenylyltransferase [Endomicrobiaceae bacterium]MDD3922589.1 nicotinate (nicotinamide) nucleotide adenylyltransferase [Endomicrobiaceae bacterium]MDD5102269.1 nicotinate (nicotinamide) nucleotide adenylyltransferase [Endomicrobiaceae bacterium]
MANIGVLGGSFDPVHNVHLEIASQSINEFKLDFVIFVPAYLPPHKNKLEVSDKHRYKMLLLALENRKDFIIDDFEINTGSVVYTYITLDYLQKKYPNDTVKLIIGSDSFNQLDTWKKPDYIAQKYGFIVIKRPNIDIDKKSIYYEYANISYLTAQDTSSTMIRNMFKKNQDVKNKLPGKVLEYIKEYDLYKK